MPTKEELIETVMEWKRRNEKGLCAICGRPLPRAVIDASYQPTTISPLVMKVIVYIGALPEELKEYILNKGIMVCSEHFKG